MLITQKELEELNAFQGETGYTVAVYLNTDRKIYPRQEYTTVLKDLIKKAKLLAENKHLTRGYLKFVDETLDEIQSYVTYRFDRGESKGLAVFASKEKKFFRAFPLPEPFRDEIYLQPDPYLVPLLKMLSEKKRICTALVNHSRAKIFETHLGQTEQIVEISDDVPGRVKTSGWHGYGERIHSHTRDRAEKHLKNVAQRLLGMCKERCFDLLVLAGLPEITSLLTKELHSYLKNRLAGTCNLPYNVTPAQVQKKALESEARKEEEAVWKSLPKQK